MNKRGGNKKDKMTELSEKAKECYECVKAGNKGDFSIHNNCEYFQGYQALGEKICPLYNSIRSAMRKEELGLKKHLTAGTWIAQKAAEEGEVRPCHPENRFNQWNKG
jgi:hypothetical protein